MAQRRLGCLQNTVENVNKVEQHSNAADKVLMETYFDRILKQYSESHLICDGAYPLISNAMFYEEALLYNLDDELQAKVQDCFAEITGKSLGADTDLSSLSGGQKVVLMLLLALYSSAEKIVLINPCLSLDNERSRLIDLIIAEFKTLKSEIIIIEKP